jgi:hypothetical protein
MANLFGALGFSGTFQTKTRYKMRILERVMGLVPFKIKLASFTPEEAAEIYALDPKMWMFEPAEFVSRLEADPDCELRISFGGGEEPVGNEFLALHKILDQAERAECNDE